ncbi:N-acetyltransferase family protein [Kribbella sp. CA-294648]|uniref:GNAT family N-acetyltransferase n=1 Tax=Kribbella sp. CA-294648 TaxID=3239948 RepID=UPI003D90BD5E
MIEIRELTSDDWKTWRELRLAALAEAPYAFGSRLADWADAEEDRWRARLELAGSSNFVAVLDGTPVGMASGVPTDEDGVVELISMWVAPAGRGRRVGDLLMARVEQWAREVEAHTVQLSVADGNDKAHDLYLRSGFAATDIPGDLMPDGIHREIVMRKAL